MWVSMKKKDKNRIFLDFLYYKIIKHTRYHDPSWPPHPTYGNIKWDLKLKLWLETAIKLSYNWQGAGEVSTGVMFNQTVQKWTKKKRHLLPGQRFFSLWWHVIVTRLIQGDGAIDFQERITSEVWFRLVLELVLRRHKSGWTCYWRLDKNLDHGAILH